MEQGRTNLAVTEAVRSVQLLKIDGYCVTAAMEAHDCIKSRWNIDGLEWQIHFYPKYFHYEEPSDRVLLLPEWADYTEWVVLKLILVSEPQRDKLRVNLSCRLVLVHPTKPSRILHTSVEKSVSHVFHSGSKSTSIAFMQAHKLTSSSYIVNDSLTVECTVTVLHDLGIAGEEQPLPMPPSDMHQHLGELLQSKDGADVTFFVSGESFAAHKVILAARSPVFKAEFFGAMGESSSKSVEIEDMEADVFKTMLHFIYTDVAPPELDGEPAMAQHLLAAADRYGLNRLKLICEGKLSGGIDNDTAATTLALAEQHNCSLLKAKCLEFITKSPKTLDAVLATDGYRHLMASCPLVLTELLRAARKRKI